MQIYILNESSEPDVMGALTLYHDLNALLGDVEGIDVIAGEYFVFSSCGHRIELRAEHEYAKVTIITHPPDDRSRKIATKLVRDYLFFLAKDGRFGVAAVDLKKTTNICDMMKLLPTEVIE